MSIERDMTKPRDMLMHPATLPMPATLSTLQYPIEDVDVPQQLQDDFWNSPRTITTLELYHRYPDLRQAILDEFQSTCNENTTGRPFSTTPTSGAKLSLTLLPSCVPTCGIRQQSNDRRSNSNVMIPIPSHAATQQPPSKSSNSTSISETVYDDEGVLGMAKRPRLQPNDTVESLIATYGCLINAEIALCPSSNLQSCLDHPYRKEN